MTEYKRKAKDSFQTRIKFFVFYCIIYEKDFDEKGFEQFELADHQDFINAFVSQYYQWESKDHLEINGVKTELSINDIYAYTKSEKYKELVYTDWFENYFESFVKQYPYERFTEDKDGPCYYCGISLEEIFELAEGQNLNNKRERGFSIEIDRRRPNLEYTTENCVPSCYWCNNAKSDEFDDVDYLVLNEAESTLSKF